MEIKRGAKLTDNGTKKGFYQFFFNKIEFFIPTQALICKF